MPRRKRIHIPGFLWHITHRCHKKEHLLKFEKDRKTWRDWLFKAKKRYGLRVITYAVTCNHIHLLAVDSGKDIISKSMQLLSGNTGQAYNSRKNRNALLSCCGITDPDEFRTYYEDLVAYTLQHGSLSRESLWTNNLAVGSRQYIEQNQDKSIF